MVRLPGRDGAAAPASLTTGGGRKGLGAARGAQGEGDAEVGEGPLGRSAAGVPARPLPARASRSQRHPQAAFKS